ncbi:hypothetical protein [Nocardia sp. CNY236]|uniref:hypothetical protein n=1 Tax=Nocardia sp. CNY236 TaxID=1169152 RepID=UPI000419BE5E|nr:hypothetical protein [Nocardia sp. CNY236]
MAAESVVTLGVSTERGVARAVALRDGEKLAERVLSRRVERIDGESDAEVAAAVESALDALAAGLDSEWEIGGAAVAYRDAAQRRAVVTRLAAGRWHTASMVSAKSAHLSVSGMMTWLDVYDNLLICEAVAGYRAFTLVDRGRCRVLAAVGQAGPGTPHSLDAAVAAAWDQLDAAATRPDAVAVIGSAGADRAVLAALEGFGVPVVPCTLAAFASAAGAASSVHVELQTCVEPEDQPQRARGGVALFAAAGVLASGVVVGGGLMVKGPSNPPPAVIAAEAHGVDPQPPVEGPTETESAPARADVSLAEAPGPIAVSTAIGLQRSGASAWSGSVPLVATEPANAVAAQPGEQIRTPLVPGAGIPSNPKLGAPNGALLFPGEAPPPAWFTPEAADWWDEHLRLMAHWTAQQLLPS